MDQSKMELEKKKISLIIGKVGLENMVWATLDFL